MSSENNLIAEEEEEDDEDDEEEIEINNNNNNDNDDDDNNKITDDVHNHCHFDDKKWFVENGPLHSDDILISTRIDDVIYQHKSKYQNILVFKNKLFGRCMVLDNAMQCTELDEWAYQEMISFLPLNLHENPKKVLIVGGGDGGVARECSKHPLVENIVQCEIDNDVVETSKRFLPFMSDGFNNNKVLLHCEDGFDFVRKHPNEFDVIITDSCDPKGPAEILFQENYYKDLWKCLHPNGIICSQAQSYWFEMKFIKSLYKKISKIFQSVSYATISIPSYPPGQIGFLIASKENGLNFSIPRHKFTEEQCQMMKLKYYSIEMHQASFVLPRYFKKQLTDEIDEDN